MKTEEKVFLSSDGETTVTYYIFNPEKLPVAILQICHGMAEYLMRYADFAEYLTQRGIVVCGCDHLGHGKSLRAEGIPGYFGKGKNLDVLLKDQRQLILEIRKKYRHLPYVLLGHSMGSFIARRFISEYRELIDGVILCATAGPGTPASLGVTLSSVVGIFSGKLKQSKILNRIAFAGYNKRTGSNTPNAWLTRDEKIVNAYNTDELCGFCFTPSAYKQLFQCIKTVNDKLWAESVDQSLSVLIAAGEEDPVGAYGIGPRKVFDALVEAELTDVTLKMYPGCRHEILNELNRQEVYKDFLDFVLKVTENVRILNGGVS